MKKAYGICCLLFLGLFFGACEFETSQDPNAPIKIKPGDELKDLGKKMEESMKKLESKSKSRRESGDTVALHYNELEKYLPNVSGYEKAGDPKGSYNSALKVSFSQVEQKYKSSSGDNLEVTIIDYLGASALYGMASMAYKANIHRESDKELIKTLHIGVEDVFGLETYKKVKKKSTVNLAVGSRFIITIKADNQEDATFIKDIAKSMKLEELVKR